MQKKEFKILMIIVGLILVLITGVLVYLNQYEIRKMEKEIKQLEQKIDNYMGELKVLNTEWIYLTNANRIKEIINYNNLNFKRLKARDYVSIKEIPLKGKNKTTNKQGYEIINTYYFKE